jgi:hypothetical protein
MSIDRTINLLDVAIEQGKPFLAQGGSIENAPFKDFSVDKKLVKHWAKNLIGASGLGQPKLISGVKASGAPMLFDFSTLGVPVGGLGIEILVITPDLTVAQTTITGVYSVVPGTIVHTIQFLPIEKQARFGFVASYANNNEVWPIVQSNPILSIADGKIADGSSVTVYIYDLANDRVKEVVKKYAKE